MPEPVHIHCTCTRT